MSPMSSSQLGSQAQNESQNFYHKQHPMEDLAHPYFDNEAEDGGGDPHANPNSSERQSSNSPIRLKESTMMSFSSIPASGS